jgi:hypothetical protein
MCGGNKLFSKFQKWCDELKLAGIGILLAFKNRRFKVFFLVSFVFFGTLLNLLSSGGASFSILLSVSLPKKIDMVFHAFLGIFGIERNFADFLYNLGFTLLQSVLIGLVALVYKSRKDSANLQNASIITGLIILSSGCPTCGTTLLTPVIISIVGSSGMALAGTMSTLFVALSLILAFFALKKMGFESYIIYKAKKFSEKKGKNEK